MKKDGGVIRPGDIPVKAKHFKTVLSPVVSDLAASILKDIDPLEMGVRPPRRLGFVDVAEWRQKIRATRRRVNQLLRNYSP
jgi:hypothetical protein